MIKELCVYAEKHRIDVDWFSMSRAASLSVPLTDGSCAVAIDPAKLRDSRDEVVKLAHEIGHCETGSFYNPYAPLDLRQKHERRADKWATKKLVPKDELEAAFKKGIVQLWELAELFGVTEDFMRKAILFYQGG